MNKELHDANHQIPGECWEAYGIHSNPALPYSQKKIVGSYRYNVPTQRISNGKKPPILQVVSSFIVMLCVCVLMVGCYSENMFVSAANTDAIETTLIAVNDGESLWSISANHPIAGLSTQECVTWLIEANGLDGSTIYPGQIIRVPLSV